MKFAALIIDMQEDFFSHERLAQRRESLTKRMNDLLGICRDNGVPVVWVKQDYDPDESEGLTATCQNGISVVTAGMPGAAVLPELDQQLSDFHVVKKFYSAFSGTNIDEFLAEAQPTHLIVAGIHTHACVRTAAKDASQRGYKIILARECIDSYDAYHHELSWHHMDGKLGQGMNNEEIRSLLQANIVQGN